ncbi:MAG: ester cyclase [Chitinophagales bacterium]
MKIWKHTRSTYLLLVLFLFTGTFFSACKQEKPDKAALTKANIKLYTEVWDQIINKGKLHLINDTNFTKDLVMHEGKLDVVGLDSARAYYANFITGFTNIHFTINAVFGDGDKIVKYWNFTGTHSGTFFGIERTGRAINIEGVTLVRMDNGKIAEERDFIDKLELMQQLGQLPRNDE